MATSGVRYRGIDRQGASVSGTLREGDNLADFVQRKYRQGWRALTVARDGVQVGGIVRREGRPLWWSE